MAKVLGVLVLLLALGGGYWAWMNLGKEPFDGEKIAADILLNVGSTTVADGFICSQLTVAFPKASCKPNRYSAAEAKTYIDKVLSNYKGRSKQDWQVSEVGYTKIFEDSGRIKRSLTLLVSNDVVLVGY